MTLRHAVRVAIAVRVVGGLVAPRRSARRSRTCVRASFQDAVQGALVGDGSGLTELLAPEAVWVNPVGEYGDADACAGLVAEAAAFFEAPRFDVYGAEELSEATTRYRWVASGGWPVAWAPRVVVHGSSAVTVDESSGRAVRVEDDWALSPGAVVLGQVAPRFWDVYNLFATPTAERPGEATVGTVKGAKIVRVPPRLALVATVVDVSNSRRQRVASALPDFCFQAKARDPSRGATTTAPLAVSVETLPKGGEEEQGKPRRLVTWSLPVPSAFGVEAGSSDLPDLGEFADLKDASLAAGVAELPTLRYVFEPEKHLLVAPYGGDVQDSEADALRRKLLDVAAANGLTPKPGPNGGAPPALLRKWQTKLGFTPKGECVYAAYANAPWFLPFDRDDLAIEIEAPAP